MMHIVLSQAVLLIVYKFKLTMTPYSHIFTGIIAQKKDETDWYEVNAISVSCMIGVDAEFEFPAIFIGNTY